MRSSHRKHSHKGRSRTAIVRVAPARPIVIKTRAAGTTHHKKKHHRKHGGGFGSFLGSHQLKAGIGGAALGFIHKQFPNLPAVPILGVNGTVAIAANMLRGKLPFADEVATAAMVIAGYQLASEGTIHGGYIAGY